MNDDTADILYPSMKQDAPRPTAEPVDAASVLYPNQGKDDNPPLDRYGYRLKPGEVDTSPEAKPEAKPEPTPKSPEHVARVAEVIAEKLQLDPQSEMTGEFSKTAAELGLSVEQTQKVADLHVKHSTQYWSKTWDGWKTESAAIPQDDIRAAQSFVRNFGDSELTALLNDYHLGDHPAIIKAFARAAKGKAQ